MSDENQVTDTQVTDAQAATATPAVVAFDVDSIEEVSTGELVVKHPQTGEPTTLVLVLAGPEHPLRKKKAFDRIRHLRKESAKAGKIKFDDPADEEQDEKAYVSSCILGWKGLIRGGVEVAYSPSAACELIYPSAKRWLRDQVKVALDERENFIQTCAAA